MLGSAATAALQAGLALGSPDGHRNWPGEFSASPFQTTATTSDGSITAQPLSRSRRMVPSGHTSTPVSFLCSDTANPICPTLLTTREMVPDLPMRGLSRSWIVSPVILHHLHRSSGGIFLGAGQ